jgi:hypothetical protein
MRIRLDDGASREPLLGHWRIHWRAAGREAHFPRKWRFGKRVPKPCLRAPVKFWSSSRDESWRPVARAPRLERLGWRRWRSMAKRGDGFHRNRTQEVAGSSPASSIPRRTKVAGTNPRALREGRVAAATRSALRRERGDRNPTSESRRSPCVLPSLRRRKSGNERPRTRGLLHTFFSRQDTVEQTWRIIQPLLDYPPRNHPYRRGSWGPVAARELAKPRGGWRLPWTSSG